MTGLLLRAPAEIAVRIRTALGDDARGTLDPSHPSIKDGVFIAMEPGVTGHGARACASRAAHLADAVPVSQVTWTSAQHIADAVPERH